MEKLFGNRKISESELRLIISKSRNYSEIIKRIGMAASGSNLKTLKNWISEIGIDLDTLKLNFLDKKYKFLKDSELFCKNSSGSSSSVRKRVIKDNLITYKCTECGLSNWWRKNPLVLQLDHINGNTSDNRLENLRFLCPNCHSQTDTFGSRNRKFNLKLKNRCKICKKSINRVSSHCNKCNGSLRRNKNTKINWPSIEDLLKMIKESNFFQVGKKLGVSDNVVRKKIRSFGLDPKNLVILMFFLFVI